MSPTPASHFGAQSSTVAGVSNAGAPDPIDMWGRDYGLDAEECGYLRKLGFRVGDKLDTISEKMWEAASVPILRRVSILKAYSLSLEASGVHGDK